MSKQIRVALSGSGFKFPAHVGALRAIEDAGYEIIEIAGTSGGSIVSALYASGMPLDHMQEMTMNENWSRMLTPSLWSIATMQGYCNGDALHLWIEEQTHGMHFNETRIPLTIMASDVSDETPYEFSRKQTPTVSIATAARASAAIPAAYTPVRTTDNCWLVDGGCCNNIPADKLVQDDIPRLGVQLVSKTTPWRPTNFKIIDMFPHLLNMILSANENTHVEMDKYEGTAFAFIETGYASSMNRNMNTALREQLYKDGYEGASKGLAAMVVK